MSKAITLLAVVAGGAATYAWLRKSGRTGQLESQVDGAVNKVRNAFTSGDPMKDAQMGIQHKASDMADNVADHAEAVTS